MSGLGTMITAFQGDPSFRTLRNVKDPLLQRQIGAARADAGGVYADSKAALGDYITKYLSGVKDAEVRSGQEIGSIDKFFDGSTASELAQLRATRGKAMTDAATLATEQALRRAGSDGVVGSGGGSSYADRTAIGALQPIRVQAALDNSTQARTDMGYLTDLQQGAIGRRQALADNNAAYGLKPIGMEQSVFSNNLNNLSGLASLNNANNIYGVQKESTDLDRIGNFLGGAASSYTSSIAPNMAAAGAAGVPTGMGGGGMSL